MVHRQNKVGTFKHKLFTLGQQWVDRLLIILILVVFSNSSNNCDPGIYSPGIPKRPPRTDIGSFEYVISPSDKSERNIVTYWQSIEDYDQCGESFEYIAYYIHTSADKQITTYRSDVTGKNYAKFNFLSTSIGNEFIIISYDKEGASIEYSIVYVPSKSDKLHKPKHFKKNVLDKQGIFELSRESADSKELSTGNQLDYYTLYWCEVEIFDHFFPPLYCNGHMDWIHVPISIYRYNIILVDKMKIYIWAISVNRANGIDNLKPSMVWQPPQGEFLNADAIFQL
ncbi:unnamed protein product [Macrosiphum euphorbiae]|uniref:Uncharacterized protein n=1 Tax=Macrosiphum euphorbiae TaxID=13131 RepID=A0AAV0WPS6_9HEMI|nr:unnamed protein product [Macrosiphum euphorbiae]